MRVDRDLVIRARGNIDGPEIDVDDQPAAGRAIEGLADVFFGQSRCRGDGDEDGADETADGDLASGS